jgi:hypothetical protein
MHFCRTAKCTVKLWRVLLTSMAVCNSANAIANVPSRPSDEELDRLAGMRAAALKKDRTAIPAIMEALSSSNDTIIATALHAACHLTAEEAIPSIEALLTSNRVPAYLKQQARGELARMKAEIAARDGATASQQAETKVKRILAEVGVTPEQVNERVSAFTLGRAGSDGRPLELYALRAIAKMAYYGEYNNFKNVPEFQQLDWNSDFAASLLIKLAPLNKSERVAWLIDELSNKKSLGKNEYILRQLAIDEGLAASRAAASMLQQMSGHWEVYAHTGFAALFHVIDGVGDKEQAPVLEKFLTGAPPQVIACAQQAYPHIVKGQRTQYAAGF